ncbi:DUF3696 domain-containing protein [Weeksellaceae bacterium KMM 9713]|uniref:DUF3696 domain-containing protein n=1 Tax=Profundicola chukchiensis TaxID=2961959 RepID=A0A9X4RUJ9_9FLAO|nr:DUF3696 domain-containing protein [Profundicola chukchiensis]MDG4945751.1 DUF3696 domain-containing protein [Profundicola chukchiensis]
MKIGIENFRTFKEYTEFEIRPITILIGPNNSGKSSFTKFLLLLKNGWEKLDFLEKNESNLESYEKSLNWDSDSKEITVKFTVNNNILFNNETVTLTYDENGKVKQFSLFNGLIKSKRRTIIRDEADEPEGPIYQIEEIDENSICLSIDIQNFLNNIIDCAKRILNTSTNNFTLSKMIDLNTIGSEDIKINIHDSKQVVELINKFKSSVFKSLSLEKYYPTLFIVLIHDVINNNHTNRILYDVHVNNENLTDVYKDVIAEIQENVFKKLNRIKINKDYWNIPDMIFKGFSEINQFSKALIEIEIKNKLLEFTTLEELPQVIVSENNLGKMLFSKTYEVNGKQIDFSKYDKLDFSNLFLSNLFDNLQDLSEVSYIPANRGSQHRVHQKGSYSFKLASKFNTYNLNQESSNNATLKQLETYKNYLKEVSNALKLDGEINVKFFEGSVSAIYLNDQNLADYGFGYSQIIPILIELFNVSYNKSKYLIIEEPEANLHPALQSKLADVFMITNKFFPNINLIIETHSEYIIRKLQYLVAADKVNSEQCIIHYFNANENVSQEEPKVKPIEINEDGNLTDNFGPGFYDEATRLQFELMKIRQEQKN